jgi:hypothetical protein
MALSNHLRIFLCGYAASYELEPLAGEPLAQPMELSQDYIKCQNNKLKFRRKSCAAFETPCHEAGAGTARYRPGR